MPIPLAPRDLLILSVLSEGPLHGYGIIQAVRERSESGVLLDPANLYRVLHRMRRDDWIRDVAGEDDRKRRYEVTPLGQRLLKAEVDRLRRLLHEVQPHLPSEAEGVT